MTLGAVAATVTNPLFGALSYRTRSRLGARHPWIIGGSVFGLASMGLLLVAPSIGILLTAWVLVQVFYNALLAGAAGLLADAVPDAERGRASGAFSAAALLGAVPPLLLSSLLPDHVGTVTMAMSLLAVILTPREREVLTALASPDSLAQIAARLHVSVNTIKSQVRSLYRRMGVSSRHEVIAEATRLGLVSLPASP